MESPHGVSVFPISRAHFCCIVSVCHDAVVSQYVLLYVGATFSAEYFDELTTHTSSCIRSYRDAVSRDRRRAQLQTLFDVCDHAKVWSDNKSPYMSVASLHGRGQLPPPQKKNLCCRKIVEKCSFLVNFKSGPKMLNFLAGTPNCRKI